MRQKIGDTGPTNLRSIFPLTSVLSKPPQLLYGVKKSWKSSFCYLFFCQRRTSMTIRRFVLTEQYWKNLQRGVSMGSPILTIVDGVVLAVSTEPFPIHLLSRHWQKTKLKKLGFHEKLGFLTPYGNWGGFGKTELSGNILRNFIDPGSPMFCLTK